MKYQRLISVLGAARAYVALPDNDFSWSSWDDAVSALNEIDGLLARLQANELPPTHALSILFAPTGPMQELSVSSGWGDKFLRLASDFDEALGETTAGAAG